jgi:hypothetical protein
VPEIQRRDVLGDWLEDVGYLPFGSWKASVKTHSSILNVLGQSYGCGVWGRDR